MATLKIILKNNKINSNGEVPLYLRIIKDRNQSELINENSDTDILHIYIDPS